MSLESKIDDGYVLNIVLRSPSAISCARVPLSALTSSSGLSASYDHSPFSPCSASQQYAKDMRGGQLLSYINVEACLGPLRILLPQSADEVVLEDVAIADRVPPHDGSQPGASGQGCQVFRHAERQKWTATR